MPPIAVHLALAATAVWLVARRLERTTDRSAAGLGIVAGAVMVDAGLAVSSLAYVTTGSVEPGEVIRRSLTHSFLFVAVVALAGAALLRSRRRRWGIVATAFAASATFLHVLPDALYLVGVKALYPFSMEEFHYGPFAKARFSDTANNVMSGVGFMLESIAWTWTWWIALRYRTDNRFTNLLPWLAAVNLLVFVTLTSVFASRQGHEEFLVTALVPGFFTVVVSTLLLPVMARATWRALARGPPLDRRARGSASRAARASKL